MIIEESYTFDDVLLQPAYSKIGPADANVGTCLLYTSDAADE